MCFITTSVRVLGRPENGKTKFLYFYFYFIFYPNIVQVFIILNEIIKNIVNLLQYPTGILKTNYILLFIDC